mmetsp:Transcript_72922/g.106961  ORF Transcript_72922/g.106961 Transcript_72922/m.106961 type:complete len:330 (+) Transcript_72922:354-1343(+)
MLLLLTILHTLCKTGRSAAMVSGCNAVVIAIHVVIVIIGLHTAVSVHSAMMRAVEAVTAHARHFAHIPRVNQIVVGRLHLAAKGEVVKGSLFDSGRILVGLRSKVAECKIVKGARVGIISSFGTALLVVVAAEGIEEVKIIDWGCRQVVVGARHVSLILIPLLLRRIGARTPMPHHPRTILLVVIPVLRSSIVRGSILACAQRVSGRLRVWRYSGHGQCTRRRCFGARMQGKLIHAHQRLFIDVFFSLGPHPAKKEDVATFALHVVFLSNLVAVGRADLHGQATVEITKMIRCFAIFQTETRACHLVLCWVPVVARRHIIIDYCALALG